MSRVDKLYMEMASKIKTTGISELDVPNSEVRPVWDDGESAYAIYLPQQFISYNPSETPLISLRRIAWKTAIKEILWIYQDKCNDVNLLKEKYNVNYWDEWANSEGNLGTAYGYQICKEFKSPETGEMTNQIDRLINGLKNDPLNRRHFMTMLNMNELADMTLIPCAFMTMWTVAGNRLNMTLIQRSGDFLAAAAPGGINAFQYYALLLMVAKVTGYEPGEFVHFVQNLHIYNRHMPIVDDIIGKYDENKPVPKLVLNNDVKNFYDITIDDFELLDYHPDLTKYTIPIAV